MPTVPLGRGKYATVDASDLPWVASRSWHLGSGGHAMTWITEDGKRSKRCMHTVLLEPEPGYCVQHINGQKLDYRRENLRLVLPDVAASSNWMYRSDRRSVYKGVTQNTRGDRWLAQRWIKENGRKRLKYLGSFKTEEEAAQAYTADVRCAARAASKAPAAHGNS